MKKQLIKAVLFDLGDTLMYSPDAWGPVFERAGRKLEDSLCQNKVKVACDNFYLEFLKQLDLYYEDRERNLIEISVMSMLQNLLADRGMGWVPESILRQALDEFYKVTQMNWKLEPDTIPMLTTLQNAGLHLGLISNAGDHQDVIRLVELFDIRKYFDFVITSASCGYRKPHPYMFGRALEKWNLLPDEVAMVGDRLDADISGAKPLGIFSIWIRRREGDAQLEPIQPDVTVESLKEVPPLIIEQATVSN